MGPFFKHMWSRLPCIVLLSTPIKTTCGQFLSDLIDHVDKKKKKSVYYVVYRVLSAIGTLVLHKGKQSEWE